MKSDPEIFLDELNHEIKQIVKSNVENQTSYFPNVGMLLQAFQLYLESIDPSEKVEKLFLTIQHNSLVFAEAVNMANLTNCPRFVKRVMGWDFKFKNQFIRLINGQKTQEKREQKSFLSKVSAKQIILLMYVGIQLERREIMGRGIKLDKNQTFVIKETMKILQDIVNFDEETNDKFEPIFTQNQFYINQEKLLEKIQDRTLKIKSCQQNFSFGPISSKNSTQKNSIKNASSINKILKNKGEEMGNNSSLVSVKSEFQQSEVFDLKSQIMKKENEEIFKGILLSGKKILKK